MLGRDLGLDFVDRVGSRESRSVDSMTQQFLAYFDEGRISECKQLLTDLVSVIPDDFNEEAVIRGFLSTLMRLTRDNNELVCPLFHVLIFLTYNHSTEITGRVFLESPQLISNLLEVAATGDSPLGARDPVQFDCLALILLGNVIHDSADFGRCFLEMNGLEILDKTIRTGDQKQANAALHTAVQLVHKVNIQMSFDGRDSLVRAVINRFGQKYEDWPVLYIHFLSVCVQNGIPVFDFINYRSIMHVYPHPSGSTDIIIAMLGLICDFCRCARAESIDFSVCEIDFKSIIACFQDRRLPATELMSFVDEIVGMYPESTMAIADLRFLEMMDSWVKNSEVETIDAIHGTFCRIVSHIPKSMGHYFLVDLTQTGILSSLSRFGLDLGDWKACGEFLSSMDHLLGMCERCPIMTESFFSSAEKQGVWEAIDEIVCGSDAPFKITQQSRVLLQRKNAMTDNSGGSYHTLAQEWLSDDGYAPYSDEDG